jgi:hypothetical protein
MYRILRARQDVAEITTSSSVYDTILRVVVESGLIYTTTSLAFVITVLTGGAEMYIVADSVSGPLPLFLTIKSVCACYVVLLVHPNRTDLLQSHDHPHALESRRT